MKKLNLLLIINDYSQWVSSNPFYLQTELSKITNLFVWHHSGDMTDILNIIPFKPDFILIYLFATEGPVITGLSAISIPYGVYFDDLHHHPRKVNEIMKRENVQHIFSCPRDAFPQFYPEFSDKVKWLPHHVNTEIFKDYGKEKDIDMLMMGAAYPYFYPLRDKIISTYKNTDNFVYHPHPGYRNIKGEQKNVFVRERYAQEINRAKLFFTCNSIYKYTVKKYFEVPACNTLLLAPSSDEILDLGFKPGVHFVEIDESNFKEKAEYYLKNDEEREEISKNGYDLVHKNHTTPIRAKQLTDMILEIIKEKQ